MLLSAFGTFSEKPQKIYKWEGSIQACCVNVYQLSYHLHPFLWLKCKYIIRLWGVEVGALYIKAYSLFASGQITECFSGTHSSTTVFNAGVKSYVAMSGQTRATFIDYLYFQSPYISMGIYNCCTMQCIQHTNRHVVTHAIRYALWAQGHATWIDTLLGCKNVLSIHKVNIREIPWVIKGDLGARILIYERNVWVSPIKMSHTWSKLDNMSV